MVQVAVVLPLADLLTVVIPLSALVFEEEVKNMFT
jgi:hypothetical protein